MYDEELMHTAMDIIRTRDDQLMHAETRRNKKGKPIGMTNEEWANLLAKEALRNKAEKNREEKEKAEKEKAEKEKAERNKPKEDRRAGRVIYSKEYENNKPTYNKNSEEYMQELEKKVDPNQVDKYVKSRIDYRLQNKMDPQVQAYAIEISKNPDQYIKNSQAVNNILFKWTQNQARETMIDAVSFVHGFYGLPLDRAEKMVRKRWTEDKIDNELANELSNRYFNTALARRKR